MKRGWMAGALALGLAMALTACGTNTGEGTMADRTGNNTAYGPAAGRVAYEKSKAAQRRTAYDYLNDGRYAADKDGQVDGKTNSAARDFTQDARDLMRDSEKAVGDAGKAVGDAIDRLGGGVRDVTRDVTGQ